MMIRHLFKNFWLSFTRNSLQVLGLFLMLVIIITLFGGIIMSRSLSMAQLALIGNDLYDTNISFQFNHNLKIVSNHQNLSYGLNNINYINEDGELDNNKVESPYFQLKPNGKDTYQIVLDSESNQPGKWLASNSLNSYFMEQLKENGEVILNFNTNIFPDSVYFFSNADYHELVSYLQNSANLIPFVSSPDNLRLLTGTLIFTNAYKDFSTNQKRIYDLQNRLLNSVIIGSVADRALMSATMRLYDIFKAEKFYIQSVQPYYWTTPIMAKGKYQDFLNYKVCDDYPPIIINNSYASNNKIKINDFFNIYGYQYRVIGFATNAYVNSAANESSFIYNPYLWLRGPDYTNLLTKITNDAPQLINSIISIHAAFASTELNPGFLHAQNSWSNIANVYDNATFSRSAVAYTPLHYMKEIIKNKEDIICSILIAISLLLIISSFIMISIIVNNLLLLNRRIIGNLKAQAYGTGTIAFLLLSCFLLLMFIISSLSLITSWIFSFILNITYQGFLEFTTYISVPPWWLIVGIYLLPSFVVCFYAFLFIIIEVSRPTLVLLKPKVVKKRIPKGHHLLHLNFKYKISLKFVLDAKWKLLLTFVVTTLTGAMLFTVLTTIINFSQINLNLTANANWKYVYRYDNNYNYGASETPSYDYLVYENPEAVKEPDVSGYYLLQPETRQFTEELVLKKYNTFGFGDPVCGPFVGDSNIIKSFKYKWFKARYYEWYVENCKDTQYYKQITKFIKGTVYEYFINQLSKEDGLITIGYQPIIYGPYQSEIFANTENLYARQAINYSLLEQFLNEYQIDNKNSKIDLSIPTFYQNFISHRNLKSLYGRAIEFYDYKNNTTLFYPNVEKKTDINWFFNKIKSFDQPDDDSLLRAAQTNRFSPVVNYAILQVNEMKKLIQSKKWFHGKNPNWDPKNYLIQLYPIIINYAYRYLNNINIGDILLDNFNDRSAIFYIVVDQFDNGMKNMFLINKYNNQRLKPKCLVNLYSALHDNEIYHYIGIYDKNNNYDASFKTKYEPAPIYNWTQNLKILLQQTVNLQIILFLIYLLILVTSIVACIFQIFIITNIILKDNLKVLNSFKALGYYDLWIFNRMFLIYLPIILISWVISIPIGITIIGFIRYQIIFNMLSYVSGIVNIGDYLISFLGLLVMFIIAFVLNKKFMDHRYPILKTMNWN